MKVGAKRTFQCIVVQILYHPGLFHTLLHHLHMCAFSLFSDAQTDNDPEPLNCPEPQLLMETLPPVDNSSADPLINTHMTVASQTPMSLSSNTPRKCGLRQQLNISRVGNCRRKRACKMWKKKYMGVIAKSRVPKSTLKSVDEILSSTAKLLTKDGQQFFATQLHFASKRARGRRYSNEMKCLALQLFHRGPKAYNFLSSIFTLPSRSSLCMWINALTVQPGFSDDVLRAVQLRVQELCPRDRVCSLLVDEMSFKSNMTYDRQFDVVVGHEDLGLGHQRSKLVASNALTFMVRGLASNWKQPIGFAFTHSACSVNVLHSLLIECLDKLFAIGLHVAVVISDQGSNFLKLTKQLGICTSHPYFEVHGRHYFYLFDPPHLLKSIRNNLQKYCFVFDGKKKASWDDIAQFYTIDEQQRFRLAPKLTQKHINLPAFSKMKVKTAAQVLSRTVAAALETHAQLTGRKNSETAEFIYAFDQLFDALNSSQLHCLKEFKCAISSNSGHLSFLKDRLKWLETLKVINKDNKDVSNIIKCVSGWQLTVSSVIQLWSVLNNEHGFDFLFTRRLNQDPIENFFSVVRQRGGNCDNPTPLLFCRLFKQICCRSLLTPVVGANCESDCGSLLEIVNTHKQTRPSLCFQNAPVKPVSNELLAMTCTSDHQCFEDNGLYYVSGFLLRQLLKWHSCDVCDKLWTPRESVSKLNDVYITARSYSAKELKEGHGLVTVSEAFFMYISNCEELFQSVFAKHGHERGILSRIVAELMCYSAPVSCAQFPKLKFLAYFVRMRIYYTLKFANRKQLRTKPETKKHRKLSKLQHL